MSKKKKKRTKSPKGHTVKSEENARAITEKGRMSLVLIVSILVAIVVSIYLWLQVSDQLATPPVEKLTETKRKSFPNLPAKTLKNIVFEDFVGAEACASCHTDIYNKWKSSTHGQAGGSPKDVKVIGQFDGVPRKFKDAVLTPYRSENGDYMFNLKTVDLPEQVYKVDGVVGGGHMIAGGTQTYFSYFPDGTMRMLPFDFIRDEKVWFGETSRGEGWVPITPDRIIDKESEWFPSRVLGTHLDKQNCQECHGSQIQSKYALDKKLFSTKFTTLAINCESCHGPGKDHIRIVSKPNWQNENSLGFTALVTLDKEESLKTCFRCHSLKNSLEPGYLPGNDLEEFYSTKFAILGFRKENPYHPDGRVKEFAYQQNHLNSDCYINGSMTCVSCHEPHGQSYWDINGKTLADPFDDGQCTSCHPSKAINIPAHSFHKMGSEGSKCVSCHMPYLQHKAMGSHLKFARSDHTIPIPRPAFDDSIGIESACIQCHSDKSVDFLQRKVTEWYGDIKPHNDMVKRLLEFNPGMTFKEASDILLPESTNHSMGQMAALSEFTYLYLKPNMTFVDTETIDKIKNYIESVDIDVQSMAMASLHLSADNDDLLHNLLIDKLNELDEARRRKVMKRWANALPLMGRKFEEKGDFNDAIEVYKKSLEVIPGNVPVLINLGVAYSAINQDAKAIQIFDQANAIDQNNYDVWLNKGNVLFKLGRISEAQEAYKKANEINPWNGSSYFNIGNCYYKTNAIAEAIIWYKKAIEFEPRMALGYFFLARSYLKLKDYKNAYSSVNSGLRLDPADRVGNQIRQDLESYFVRNN